MKARLRGKTMADMMMPEGMPMDPMMGGGAPPPGGMPMDPMMGGGMPPMEKNLLRKAETAIRLSATLPPAK